MPGKNGKKIFLGALSAIAASVAAVVAACLIEEEEEDQMGNNI